MQGKFNGIIGFAIGAFFGMFVLIFGAYIEVTKEKENHKKTEDFLIKVETIHLNNELKLEKKIDELELVIMGLNKVPATKIETTKLQMFHEQKMLHYNINRQINIDKHKLSIQHIFEPDNDEIKKLKALWPEF